MPRIRIELPDQLMALVKAEARKNGKNPGEWIEDLIARSFEGKMGTTNPSAAEDVPTSEMDRLRAENEELRQRILLLEVFMDPAKAARVRGTEADERATVDRASRRPGTREGSSESAQNP